MAKLYRLNKFIAHTGVCSRRKAAELVKDGQITVNGKIELNPAVEVTKKDNITYKGKQLQVVEKFTYLLLNKPKNVLTTLSDDRGRKTVWDMVKEKVSDRIYPVGRLDRNTTGLLLLTNDGDMAKRLSHPSGNVTKTYIITLSEKVSPEHINEIKDGITLEDGPVKVDRISFLPDASRHSVSLDVHIGRNRIVRRIFEHFGYQVEKLDRIYYAGLTKKGLPRGWSRFLTQKEIVMLKHFS